MAQTVNDANAQNGQESEFARFQRAMKTILKVPKEEVLKREEALKENGAKTGKRHA